MPITEYPIGRGGLLRYDRKAFPATLDTGKWLPPPYKQKYRDDRFLWSKPTCIVCNKATDEQYLWHRAPTNFMDAELLLSVIGKLRERYQVIYNRPRAADIVNDHQKIHESGDIDAVRQAYPDVLTIQELRARHPELGFNELQLRLFAGCEKFVSVLGGTRISPATSAGQMSSMHGVDGRSRAEHINAGSISFPARALSLRIRSVACCTRSRRSCFDSISPIASHIAQNVVAFRRIGAQVTIQRTEKAANHRIRAVRRRVVVQAKAAQWDHAWIRACIREVPVELASSHQTGYIDTVSSTISRSRTVGPWQSAACAP